MLILQNLTTSFLMIVFPKVFTASYWVKTQPVTELSFIDVQYITS